MALNQACIGRVYSEGDPWVVEAPGARAYADATGATNPAYGDGAGQLAPPMFGAVFQFLAMGRPLFDPELGVNMLRLVHAEQDMRFLGPVHVGDVITTVTTIRSIEDKTSGELLDVTLRSTNQHGQPVLETAAGLFIRGRTRRGAGAGGAEEERREDASPAGELVGNHPITMSADQSLRYADASGDHNPIHKEADVARRTGLPDIIVHGMCTMAMVHNTLVTHHCSGDPTRLRRLRVRFAKPVLNGETLAVRVHRGPTAGVLELEVHNGAGVAVLTRGLAETA